MDKEPIKGFEDARDALNIVATLQSEAYEQVQNWRRTYPWGKLEDDLPRWVLALAMKRIDRKMMEAMEEVIYDLVHMPTEEKEKD